jgi:methionine-rich copper-binding protein CopC
MRALLAALLLLAPAAGAHSELRATEPPDGARLMAPPPTLVLRFNEPVRVTSLRLVDTTGALIALRREGDAQAASVARASPEAPLPPGDYRVEWRAISADGHPIRGILRFSVGVP